MPWRCPACHTAITHHPADTGPRPGARYRCHVCRLELALDEHWIFPGTRPGQPLSNMTFLKAARRLKKGGKVEKKKAEQKKADITTHGFRSSFRDWSAEKTNAPQIVCEAALAHVVKDKAEAAYRRGDLFDKRRTLMATWAAFVTSTPADIVTISA